MKPRWLFKEEPTHYSFEDLERDGKTLWEGVKNPLARKHLRAVRKGDLILYYHTGKEKAVVGLARAASHASPDRRSKDESAVVVEVEPVRRLPRRVALSQIKARPALKDFPLVRLPRLSVMPVRAAEWAEIERMSAMSPQGRKA